jgi:hypothetical protein
MDAVRIHETYCKGYYWREMLSPTLETLGLYLTRFLLVVELDPMVSYMGYIEVGHCSDDESTYGPWFSNYVRVNVTFASTDDLDISVGPVHFRREIQMWDTGRILLDNRSTAGDCKRAVFANGS